MNNDLISRQAAIETILECCPSDFDNEYECGYDDGLRQAVHRLKHLQSAQPERKTGKWTLNKDGNWACPFCEFDPYHDNMKGMNYCPNCGAVMDERREDATNSTDLGENGHERNH